MIRRDVGEFIYMARFFETAEKSPKIRHDFFQMLNLARIFTPEGVSFVMGRVLYKGKQQEKYASIKT